MTTDITPGAVAKMLDRLTFEAVNCEIDRAFAGEIGSLLKALAADRDAWRDEAIGFVKDKSEKLIASDLRAEAAEARVAELTTAARAVIEADERGQGVGYSEAMDRLRAALKGDKP